MTKSQRPELGLWHVKPKVGLKGVYPSERLRAVIRGIAKKIELLPGALKLRGVIVI